MTPILGSLAWQAATERPDLLADPVTAALSPASPSPAAPALYVAEISPDLADTAEFCAAYDVGLDASANCVVVAGRRGDNLTTAACLVLATDRADVNKTIRKHLGVRRISFADREEAVRQTGMEYGGITPVGLPDSWPILVDTRVVAQPWLVIGSGLRRSKIAISGPDLARLPGVEVLDLALSAPRR